MIIAVTWAVYINYAVRRQQNGILNPVVEAGLLADR